MEDVDPKLIAGIGITLVLLLILIKMNMCPPPLRRRPANAALVHHIETTDEIFPVGQKDSLDGHLEVLTKQLAEKEGRLRLSKSKIRETEYEIESLKAIDPDVKDKYEDLMISLRHDLTTNDKDCKKLQEQIEWVSRRRAEIKEEALRGKKQFGQAATELANNLVVMQRGHVTDKPPPLCGSYTSLRARRVSPMGSVVAHAPTSRRMYHPATK